MDESSFYAALARYLRDTNPNADVTDVSPDANLFDLGLIDSLRMVELVIFVEDALACRIPVEKHPPRVFHSMRRIFDAFGRQVSP